jgi:hypothetical protein
MADINDYIDQYAESAMTIKLPSDYVEKTITGMFGTAAMKKLRVFQQHYGDFVTQDMWNHARRLDPEAWSYHGAQQHLQRLGVERRRIRSLSRAFSYFKVRIAGVNDLPPGIYNVEIDQIVGTQITMVLVDEYGTPKQEERKGHMAGIHTIGVNFRHDLRPELGYYHNPKKKYYYLSDDDSIKEGDTVIVDSPTTGYTCVVVVEVKHNQQMPAASKWVVSKVDDTPHKLRAERLARMALVERELNAAVERHRKLIDYEAVAKYSPEVAALLGELRALKGG